MLTRLKVSSLVSNMYFTDQNIMQQEYSTKLNFEILEMQKWNITMDRARRADEEKKKKKKKCGHLSSYHDYFLVIRNRTIVWKVVWIEYYLQLNDTRTRLPQHTSNVNIKCMGKSEWSKQLYSLYLTIFLEHWCILILLFWY